jgi:hypothetical protein
MGAPPQFPQRDSAVVIRIHERAETALKAAQAAGNELDVAEATRALGKLCAARGDGPEAERLFEDALVRLEQLDCTELAVDVREKLNQLRSRAPRCEA